VRRRLTRRRALAELGVGGAALLLAGCGVGGATAAADGSTLRSTWGDPRGDGTLTPGPGEPLVDRTELAPARPLAPQVARIAHVTDAHVLDAQSPARVTFLDRLGPPFASTFRPQEALTAQVLGGAVAAVDAFAPDAVIQGGDLIDNAQANELAQALSVLAGGAVERASGSGPYVGVQAQSDPDPFYYRPDVDAPLHPGLLAAALRTFASTGLRAPVHHVLGDHDVLVAGVLPPIPATRAIAVGDRAVWDLPARLDLPRVAATAAAPDGLPQPQAIATLIAELQGVPAVTVPADPRRRELDVAEALRSLGAAPGAARLDGHFDVGAGVRVIALDLVRRGGGSNGAVQAGQPEWLAGELEAAGERWVIVVSHQPLTASAGGAQLLELLDRHPHTLAALWGHTHRSRIIPREAPNGGYWLIATASLIDYPQQARALVVRPVAGGGVAIETWMLDHAPDRGGLGNISRALSYLDAQGGRPLRFAGTRLDRNVRLHRGPAMAA
jgi:3',5'-cyclic AMP phosphodiesterase CpdA